MFAYEEYYVPYGKTLNCCSMSEDILGSPGI